jgi:hypothetical protein
MSELLDRLWTMPLEDPVQPKLLDALTHLDEVLLWKWRATPTCTLGRRIGTQVAQACEGEQQYVAVQQTARVVGIALWERELGRIADSIGI